MEEALVKIRYVTNSAFHKTSIECNGHPNKTTIR